MSSKFERLMPVIACVCLLIFASATVGFAQDLDHVTFSGRITDSNNLPIVGGSVTATQIETGKEQTVVTNEDGRYKIIQLPPGTYNIKSAATGFGIKESQGIITVSGQNVQLDFSLAPGDVRAEQTVTINEEDTPVVDTTRTVVGGTITQREIEEIPNNSRNALDLVLTLGGTSEEALSVRDLAEDRNADPSGAPAEQGNFSLSGGASYSNNITIDGLDNNDDRSASDRFQPSIESIAEVQVITNQFSSEYGRASGGRINLRTKAGSKRFRGRAFMFFRDDRLNANTYYNNLTFYRSDGTVLRAPLERLPFTDYNPGFTLSGPVIVPYLYNGRKKTFFSVAYEYDRLNDTTLIDTYIPAVANPRFTLPTPTGATRTCDNSNTAANSPACVGVNGQPPTAGFVSPFNTTLPTPNSSNVVTARVDHQFFKGNNATFGYQFGRKNNRRTRGASTTRVEDALQVLNNNSDAFNFTDNQIFGAKTVNQFRFQYSQFTPSFETNNPLDPVVLISYRNPVSDSTQTLIAGNSTSSSNTGFAANRREKRFQFQDTLTYILGSHSLKGGFDIQSVNSQSVSLSDATGTFNFGSVLNYQNNVLSRFRQNFGTDITVKNTYYGVFVNDEFRPISNLTISYGLRYERESAISDSNNFGPRLGIAYDPFKKGKGVIRFGAGLFYNRALLRTVGDFIQNTSGDLFQFDSSLIGVSATDPRRTGILAQIATRFPKGFASVADVKAAIAAANCGTPTAPVVCSQNLGFVTNTSNAANPLRTVDPNLKIPESYQFNIGFEREIGKGLVFEANYTINKTANLWREYNTNAPIVPAGFNDFTAYLLANPYRFTNVNGTVRTYTFVLGPQNDSSGVATSTGGSCSTTAAVNCIVNLNSVNSTQTLPSSASINASNAVGTPVGIALAAVARFRPNQNLSETARVSSIGNSFYQGLILEVRSRFRKLGYGFGSTLRAAYTLSSTRDDGLNNTSNAEVNGDFTRDFSRSLQDRRNRFAFSGTLQTPSWFGSLRFAPLLRTGSAARFSLGYGSDRNLDDLSNDRPNFTGNLKDIKFREPGTNFPTTLAAQFTLPPIGSKSGNLPRNAGISPNLFVFDLSVTRDIKFGERIKLRPIIEFGNILNARIFSYGAEFINFNALGATPTVTQNTTYQNFLIPTRTYRQRTIRLGMRLDF
ncbi:MAG: carboxypeptidase regulatory-like domain-containing protein [Acidobacteriota bacterium]|nr:carboxypeptidase regulatory-like domain-containing protein [Acidobacteriota bacterium]